MLHVRDKPQISEMLLLLVPLYFHISYDTQSGEHKTRHAQDLPKTIKKPLEVSQLPLMLIIAETR
jgi:hypothetical protein